MDKEVFRSPGNEYRIYKLSHGPQPDFAAHLEAQRREGFGGFVRNAEWHRQEEKGYLTTPEDFTRLDAELDVCRKEGFGVWLYDEKGYPSGSADGLTLAGHPEYEAMGMVCLPVAGEAYTVQDGFLKIVYACRQDGTPVPFTPEKAEGADLVIAVRVAFENSHAEKCGWGPRHYPNLMDRDAVAAFLHCTYDAYYENLRNFPLFEAVFTDEPSLMTAYVNCEPGRKYALLPWQDKLPEVYRAMHGEELFDGISELFSREEKPSTKKLHYWQTVAAMISGAFFGQIRDWCHAHGIAFSGHCLLEECIGMHTPLYGNLLQCLKNLDYPGVDMLSGSPVQFRYSDSMQYAMAARYVGGVARMTGRTQKVMVEICPIHHGEEDYTYEEEVATMDQIFMCGINHINSYLDPERLKGRFHDYADHFARAAYVLRQADWCGKIGMYYPIETMQSFYHPDYAAVNGGAELTAAEKNAETTIFSLQRRLTENQLDFTVVDAEWIGQAALEQGALVGGALRITALVMPGVRVLPDAVAAKLEEFCRLGGLVLWVNGCPDGSGEAVTADPVPALKAAVDYGITVETADSKNLLISPYLREGKRVWYVINAAEHAAECTVAAPGLQAEVWENDTGKVYPLGGKLTVPPCSSVFLIEK